MNIIANKSLLTQLITVNNNQTAFVASTLTAASSSIIYSGNVGGITITNNASGGFLINDANALYVNANLFAGTSNSITATGSQDPGDTNRGSYLRQVEHSQIFGNNNGVNLPYAPTGSNSLNQTMIAGYNLGVTGSNASSFTTLTQTGGSAFFGRYNAQDANRAQSAQTIFAVGTGNSTTRKTGFLIDSGSNTFVEGSFNVSGSSAFTGSVTITGSVTVNGSSILTSNVTSSFATTGSNSFNGNQTITGSLTMSGSIITVDRSGETGNIYLGQNALGMGTAGAQPLALGNTIAVAIGNGAMRFASGSNQNVAIGNNALLVTTGSKNFGMGSEALSSNTTGQSNVGIGTSALTKNTTGESNTAIGDSAGFNVSGSNNTFIGASSGYNISGSNNTILGRYQGSSGETLTNNIILADGQGNVKAQYSGSAWSLQDGIKLNVSSNKTTDVVSVNATLTVSNSLVTANSIILVTTQNSTTGPVYPAVVTSKGAGTFSIAHNFGGNLDVAYLIINAT
jgi:hypothetical protein